MLNIFKPAMDEAMKSKQVRLWRNKTMGNVCYRYFTTCDSQLKMFSFERKFGTTDGPNKAFHVYVDEDVDRNSKEYKSLFRLSREIDDVIPKK
jgi:hypothetical protein